MLRAVETEPVAAALTRLQRHDLAGPVTSQALAWLRTMCATPESVIPRMAAEAEALVGNPAEVAAGMWALAQDLLGRLAQLETLHE